MAKWWSILILVVKSIRRNTTFFLTFSISQHVLFYKVSQRDNGVTFYVGGLSLILAIALFLSEVSICRWFFLSLRCKGCRGKRTKQNNWCGIPFTECRKKILTLIYEQTWAKARNVWLILVHYSNYLSYWASSPASFHSNTEVKQQ